MTQRLLQLNQHGRTPEFVDGATKTFGFWWLGTLEQIKRGK